MQTPDTPAKLKADHAFIEHLNDRLAKRLYTNSNRMWLSKQEIRGLRRIVNVNTSGALKHDKHRRMRVETIRQYLARAEDRLGERAAALVSEKIAPESQLHDDMVDVYESFSQKMYMQYQTAYSRHLAAQRAVLIKNIP